MTIVLDARTAVDHFPGIGRYVGELAQALAGLGLPEPLALIRPTGGGWRLLPLPDLPGEDCAATPFSFVQHWQVPGALRRLKAQVYHAPYYLMPWSPGVPTVLTCHDLIPLILPRYFTAGQRLAFRVAMRSALRTARAVIAVSECTRVDLLRHFAVPEDRVHVVPEAAASRFAPPTPAEVERVRLTHGLPARYVLYLGANKPHKNLPRLVAAWAEVARQPAGASVTLAVAGPFDPRWPEARQLAAATPRVVFVGAVPDADLPPLYGGAEAFCFPSSYEGFGLPPLEAMHCGAPVLTSGHGSLREVVGDAALVVDPTEEALARALVGLLGDPALRARLREAGRRQAARFSWERTARRTAAIYASVRG